MPREHAVNASGIQTVDLQELILPQSVPFCLQRVEISDGREESKQQQFVRIFFVQRGSECVCLCVDQYLPSKMRARHRSSYLPATSCSGLDPKQLTVKLLYAGCERSSPERPLFTLFSPRKHRGTNDGQKD